MTEKVKITQEQADEIKEIQELDYAVNIHSFNKRPDKAIAKLTTAELARALYVGYEVVSRFKVDDWVRYWKTDCVTAIGKITYINYDIGSVQFDNSTRTVRINNVTGRANQEEILKERGRRKWAEIGRKIGEIKQGDIGVLNSGQLKFDASSIEAAFRSDTLIELYPIESLVSFRDGEAE